MPPHQLTPGLPAFPPDLLLLLAQTLHADPSAGPHCSPFSEPASTVSRGSHSANDHRFHTPSQRTLWAYRYVQTLIFVDLPFIPDLPHSPLLHLITRCAQHRGLFPHLRVLHVQEQAFETCFALPLTSSTLRFRDEVLASGMHDILHALTASLAPPEIHVSPPPSSSSRTYPRAVGLPEPGLAPAERQNRFRQLVALYCKSATTEWRCPLLSVRVTTSDEPAYRAELLPFADRSRLQFAEPAVSAATLGEMTPDEEKALGETIRWVVSALEFFLTLRSFWIEKSKGAVVEICGIAGKGAGEDVVEEVKRMLLTMARETLLEHMRTWDWAWRDCAGLEETTISVYGQEYAPSMLGGQCIACGATTHPPTDDQPGGKGGIKLWAVRY